MVTKYGLLKQESNMNFLPKSVKHVVLNYINSFVYRDAVSYSFPMIKEYLQSCMK